MGYEVTASQNVIINHAQKIINNIHFSIAAVLILTWAKEAGEKKLI